MFFISCSFEHGREDRPPTESAHVRPIPQKKRKKHNLSERSMRLSREGRISSKTGPPRNDQNQCFAEEIPPLFVPRFNILHSCFPCLKCSDVWIVWYSSTLLCQTTVTSTTHTRWLKAIRTQTDLHCCLPSCLDSCETVGILDTARALRSRTSTCWWYRALEPLYS